MRRLVRALWTAWLLGWLAFAGPAQAAQIFFTSDASGTIARINDDGSGLTTILSGLSAPGAIAVDPLGRKLYWVDGIGEVQRANLDGSGLQTIYHDYNTFGVGAIALDSQARQLYLPVWGGYGYAGSFLRMDLDGGNLTTLPIAGQYDIGQGIAIDPGHDRLYWAAGTQIMASNLAGTAPPQLVFDANSPPANSPSLVPTLEALVIDPALARLFYTTFVPNYPRTANSIGTDGSGQALLVSTFADPAGLALDPAKGMFYVADGAARSITRAAYDGSGATVIFTSTEAVLKLAVLVDVPEPWSLALALPALGLLAALRRPGRRSS